MGMGNQQNSASDCARVTVAGQTRTRCRERQKNRGIAATTLKIVLDAQGAAVVLNWQCREVHV